MEIKEVAIDMYQITLQSGNKFTGTFEECQTLINNMFEDAIYGTTKEYLEIEK